MRLEPAALRYGSVTAMWGVMGTLVIGMIAAGLIALIFYLALPEENKPLRRPRSGKEYSKKTGDEKLGLANQDRMR